MINYFQLLDLPEQVPLDIDHLHTRYQALAATAHPDKGGSTKQLDTLNKAYNTLKTNSERITHLLALRQHTVDTHGTVSSDLLDTFLTTAELLQEADQHIRELATSHSALAKALLQGKTMTIQERISSQLETIDSKQTQLLSTLPITAEPADLSPLETAARDLAFMEKWQTQLRQRYATFF